MTEVTKIDHAPIASDAPKDTGIVAVIERIASNPNIDIDRMQALLKMRADEEERIRRMDREDRDADAKRAWLRDFSLAQSEIGPIVRGRPNEHTRSKYADLADIERVVTPVLSRHGFSTTSVPVPCDLDGHIRMRLTIGHREGHERVYEDDFPLDAAGSQGKVNKTAIQAKGSTQTYARRYLKASALDLAFHDDNDGNRREEIAKITAEQYVILRDLLAESGVDELTFHKAYGHRHPEDADLHEFPADRFEEAKKRLEVAKAKRSQTDG